MTSTAMAGGYVGVAYTSEDESDGDTLMLEGAVGHVSGDWGFQLDGSFGNVEFQTLDADVSSLSGHVYRAGSNWRLGLGVSTSAVDLAPADPQEIAYGVVGTYDFSPNTVMSGSFTLGEVEFLAFDIDTWNFDAGVDHYVNANWRIGASLGTGNLETTLGDGDSTTFSLNTEFQPWSTPVSFNVGYSSVDISGTVFGGLESQTLSIGARWNFGAGTLRDRDNITPFDTRTALYGRALDLR